MTRKISFTLIATAAIIGLNSCAKEYNCKCNYYADGTFIKSTTTTIYDTEEVAAQQCDAKEQSYYSNGYLVSIYCSLR